MQDIACNDPYSSGSAPYAIMETLSVSQVAPLKGDKKTEHVYASRMKNAAGLAKVRDNYHFTSMGLVGVINTKFLHRSCRI